MSSITIKRVNYFDGQYLDQDDFNLDQQYHRDQRSYQNKALYIAGVVDGLELISVPGNSNKFTVTGGRAIDSEGRLLVLPEPVVEDVSQFRSNGVGVCLYYNAAEIDKQQIGGADRGTRWDETAVVSVGCDGDYQVQLGRVNLDGGGNVTSFSFSNRDYSGIQLNGKFFIGSRLESDALLDAFALHIDGPAGPALTISSKGNVVIGGPNSAAGLTVYGEISAAGSNGSLAFTDYVWSVTDGAATLMSNGITLLSIDKTGEVKAKGTVTGHGLDVAEYFSSSGQLEAGDVVCLSGNDEKIVLSERANQSSVAGVVSSHPGLLLSNDFNDSTADEYPVALAGRVPCKVTNENGAIRCGDLLTTSSTPGYAMKALPELADGRSMYRTGTIIGKAIGSLDAVQGCIPVMVTLM